MKLRPLQIKIILHRFYCLEESSKNIAAAMMLTVDDVLNACAKNYKTFNFTFGVTRKRPEAGR